MADPRIEFEGMAWQEAAPGVRQKQVERQGCRLRLVEFGPRFEEADWCRKGHWGYVLQGRLELIFAGHTAVLAAGDGLGIPAGEAHRARVEGHAPALLLLFEESEQPVGPGGAPDTEKDPG